MREFLQPLKTRWGRWRRGQKILVAVSGGIDSMVLWQALAESAADNGWKIVVAHFNHQLRGRSSDADERLVRQAAAAMKCSVVVGRADVKAFARSSNLSLEMAARKLRHEFLARTAREQKISTVALAHHADDQVELFFLRLLRGTGGAGLAGMKWQSPSPADSKITLIRPLLDLTKAELQAFARRHKILFREDVTNAANNALRNRIRNELLPLLRRHYQPGIGKTVLRLMDIIGAEAEVVGTLAEKWQKHPSPAFEKLAMAVQRRVLQSQLISSGLVMDYELIEALRAAADTSVSVGSELTVSRDAAGQVRLAKSARTEFKAAERVIRLTSRAGAATFAGVRVNWSFATDKKMGRPPVGAGQEWFDAGKIRGQITLRHWRAGDRFQPIGLQSFAKLQDLFTNAKIPSDRRHQLLVATTASGEIFWVEGLRISEKFKLEPGTKRRLVWRWRRPQSH